MRLIELGDNRPMAAGKARLEYKTVEGMSADTRFPSRDGDTIMLPYHAELELLALQKNWNQFLVSIYGDLWFGGTDENPFLVRMDPDAFKEYLTGGPKRFYESLIPQRIEELSRVIGSEYVRQGDIFALPMDFDWETLCKAYNLLNGKELSVVKVKSEPVFGTRHSFTGQRTEFTMTVYGVGSLHIVEGKVVAPDHTPMKLVGPHAVSQTRLLHDPKIAD